MVNTNGTLCGLFLGGFSFLNEHSHHFDQLRHQHPHHKPWNHDDNDGALPRHPNHTARDRKRGPTKRHVTPTNRQHH